MSSRNLFIDEARERCPEVVPGSLDGLSMVRPARGMGLEAASTRDSEVAVPRYRAVTRVRSPESAARAGRQACIGPLKWA